MIAKISTVRNKMTNQVFEVVPGTLLPDFFEEVQKDIKVGKPKVEFEVEAMEPEEEPKIEKPVEKKKPTKKSKKTSKKGAKKNATSKK